MEKQGKSNNYGIDLRTRTKQFAVRILRLADSLPTKNSAQIICKQVSRSGTSVGAHYREAFRAKSDADFISKVEGALQELDETTYWLELLAESGIVKIELLKDLINEANELMAIFITIVLNVKKKKNK